MLGPWQTTPGPGPPVRQVAGRHMPAAWRVLHRTASGRTAGLRILQLQITLVSSPIGGTFWAGDSSQSTSEPPPCRQGFEGEAGEAGKRGVVPGAGAHPRHEPGPKAGGGSTLAPSLCGSCGRRWEAGGVWPQAWNQLYPGGWPREWGFPLRPAHSPWLYPGVRPAVGEAAGQGDRGKGPCSPREVCVPGIL